MTSDLGDVVKWPTLGRPVERRQNRSSKFDLGNGGSPSPFANYSFSTFLSFLSTIFPLLRLVFSIFDVIYVHWDRIRRSSSSSGGGGGLVALKKPGKFFFFFLLPADDDDVDDTKLIFGGAAAESRKMRRKVWRRKVVWTRRRRTLFRWCNVTLVIVPNVFNSIHSKMIRFKRCSLHFCFVRSGQSEAFVNNGGKKDSIVPHTRRLKPKKCFSFSRLQFREMSKRHKRDERLDSTQASEFFIFPTKSTTILSLSLSHSLSLSLITALLKRRRNKEWFCERVFVYSMPY